MLASITLISWNNINKRLIFQEYPVDKFILANAFKAIVGALLQSSGEEKAAHFVRDFVVTQIQGNTFFTY